MLSIYSFLLSNSSDNSSSVKIMIMSSYISHSESIVALIYFIRLVSSLIFMFINYFSLSSLLMLAWQNNCYKIIYMTPCPTCELTFLSVFYILYKLSIFSLFLNKFLCTSSLIILVIIVIFFLYAFVLVTDWVLFTMSHISFFYKINLVNFNLYTQLSNLVNFSH